MAATEDEDRVKEGLGIALLEAMAAGKACVASDIGGISEIFRGSSSGVLVPVAQASDAPIKLIGVGEGIDDLQPFDARAFARSLVGLDAAHE